MISINTRFAFLGVCTLAYFCHICVEINIVLNLRTLQLLIRVSSNLHPLRSHWSCVHSGGTSTYFLLSILNTRTFVIMKHNETTVPCTTFLHVSKEIKGMDTTGRVISLCAVGFCAEETRETPLTSKCLTSSRNRWFLAGSHYVWYDEIMKCPAEEDFDQTPLLFIQVISLNVFIGHSTHPYEIKILRLKSTWPLPFYWYINIY